MSGEFVFFWETDPGRLMGRTHGCGCCADNVEVTVENLKEHIKDLEHDLERARKIMLRLQDQKPIMDGID